MALRSFIYDFPDDWNRPPSLVRSSIIMTASSPESPELVCASLWTYHIWSLSSSHVASCSCYNFKYLMSKMIVPWLLLFLSFWFSVTYFKLLLFLIPNLRLPACKWMVSPSLCPSGAEKPQTLLWVSSSSLAPTECYLTFSDMRAFWISTNGATVYL